MLKEIKQKSQENGSQKLVQDPKSSGNENEGTSKSKITGSQNKATAKGRLNIANMKQVQRTLPRRAATNTRGQHRLNEMDEYEMNLSGNLRSHLSLDDPLLMSLKQIQKSLPATEPLKQQISQQNTSVSAHQKQNGNLSKLQPSSHSFSKSLIDKKSKRIIKQSQKEYVFDKRGEKSSQKNNEKKDTLQNGLKKSSHHRSHTNGKDYAQQAKIDHANKKLRLTQKSHKKSQHVEDTSKIDTKKSRKMDQGKKGTSSSKKAAEKNQNNNCSYEDFKNFVRILKLKHRKNIMIYQSQSHYENQYKSKMLNQLELKTRQLAQVYNSQNPNFNEENQQELMSQNQFNNVNEYDIDLMADKIDLAQQQQTFQEQQSLNIFQTQIEHQVQVLLRELEIPEDIHLDQIDEEFQQQISNCDLPLEKKEKINELFHLKYQLENVKARQTFLQQNDFQNVNLMQQMQQNEAQNPQFLQADKKDQAMDQTLQAKALFPSSQLDDFNNIEFHQEIMLQEQQALQMYRDCLEIREKLKSDGALALNNQTQLASNALDTSMQETSLQEQQLDEANTIISNYEEKYSIAYQSIIQLIINQKDNQGMQDELAYQDIDEKQESLQNKKVQQLSIDQTQLKQIVKENEFFLGLYIQINHLITNEGTPYHVFEELVQKFPCSLSDYSEFEALKQSMNKDEKFLQNNDNIQQLMRDETEQNQFLSQISAMNQEQIDGNINNDQFNGQQFQPQQQDQKNLLENINLEFLNNQDDLTKLEFIENLSENQLDNLQKYAMQMDQNTLSQLQLNQNGLQPGTENELIQALQQKGEGDEQFRCLRHVKIANLIKQKIESDQNQIQYQINQFQNEVLNYHTESQEYLKQQISSNQINRQMTEGLNLNQKEDEMVAQEQNMALQIVQEQQAQDIQNQIDAAGKQESLQNQKEIALELTNQQQSSPQPPKSVLPLSFNNDNNFQQHLQIQKIILNETTDGKQTIQSPSISLGSVSRQGSIYLRRRGGSKLKTTQRSTLVPGREQSQFKQKEGPGDKSDSLSLNSSKNQEDKGDDKAQEHE